MKQTTYTYTGSRSRLMNKTLLSMFIVILYIGLANIPTPFLNINTVEMLQESKITDIAFWTIGNTQFGFMATGISSYISASIIIQIIMYISKDLLIMSRLPSGKKVIERMTLILAIVLSLIISSVTMAGYHMTYPLFTINAWIAIPLVAIYHAIGTFIAVKLGFYIDENGIGNGVSLFLLVNILSSVPSQLIGLRTLNKINLLSNIEIAVISIAIFIMIAGLVTFNDSERKVPVRYAKSLARGKTAFSQDVEYLPFKINPNGVMPIILASVIMQVIFVVLNFFDTDVINEFQANLFTADSFLYMGLTIILVVGFTFFYGNLMFDAQETADTLQERTGSVLGVRLGKDTVEYFENMNKGLTRISALFLASVSLFPFLLNVYFEINLFQGTSLLIVVGIIADLIRTYKIEFDMISFIESDNL